MKVFLLGLLPELLLGGGAPLWHNGQVVGSVGVSGGGRPKADDQPGRAAALPEVGITIPQRLGPTLGPSFRCFHFNCFQ